MNLRRLLYDELTVSKRSRRYAEPLPSYLMTVRNAPELWETNEVRHRARTSRFPLRWPFTRKGFR